MTNKKLFTFSISDLQTLMNEYNSKKLTSDYSWYLKLLKSHKAIFKSIFDRPDFKKALRKELKNE